MKFPPKWEQRALDWMSLFTMSLPEKDARLGTASLAVYCLVGTPLYFLILHHVPAAPRWPVYASMLASVLVLVFLICETRYVGARLLFLGSVAVVSCFFFVMYPYMVDSGPRWFPFQAGKLTALFVGFIAPSLPIGMLSIGLTIGSALVCYGFLSAEIQAQLKPVEPWGLLGFAVAATLTLLHRLRIRQLELRAQSMHVEMESTKRLAQELLRIRDLMNTPLQAIEIATVLLRRLRQDEKSSAILEDQERSCARLRQLSRELAEYDYRSGRWRPFH